MFGMWRGCLCLLALFVAACSGSEALERSEEHSRAPWTISRPVGIDLGIPGDLFRGRLTAQPQLEQCHTQGLEITADQVVISCSLYDPRFKTRQGFAAESLLLSAPLEAITEPESIADSPWQVRNLTETVPPEENRRVADALLTALPKPLALFIKWMLAPESIPFRMGHPSGLHYDTEHEALWVSNAVYGPRSYSRLHQLDPRTLASAGESNLGFRDHLGLVLALPHRLLLSSAWADPPNFWLIDTVTGRSRKISAPTADLVQYQDCDLLDETTFFCVGNQVQRKGWTNELQGRLHVIGISGDHFDNLKLTHRGSVAWQETESIETFVLGKRIFSYIEGLGNIERGRKNQYGDVETSLPLSHEGFAISPDHRYVYFLPEDLPDGKLIRMELTPTTP